MARTPDLTVPPELEDAAATLRALAETFLRAGGRGAAASAAATNSATPPRVPAVLLVDEGGTIRAADAEAERILGRKSADLVGTPVEAALGYPVPAKAGESVAARVKGADGLEIACWVTTGILPVAGTSYLTVTVRERNAREENRLDLRYQHLVEQIPAVVFTASLDGGLFDIYVSPQIEGLLGFSQAEWVSNPVLWYDRLHLEDRRKLDEEFARGCATGGPFRADCRFWTRDNRVVWVHGEARLISDTRGVPVLLQGVAFDITETKRAEEVARASLREKETLLKEIHHRVKNNLQVTSSLLRLQADRIQDELARRALREGQNRIRSMALVHELLYRSKDLSNVDLGQYVRDLTRELSRSHAIDPALIKVEMQIEEAPMPVDIAVPCGLILNELVSNAFKHAFPERRPGKVFVEVRRFPTEDVLVVRDDGVGSAIAATPEAAGTLGLRLVRTLTDQIGGRLEIGSGGGTEVRLTVPRRPEGGP